MTRPALRYLPWLALGLPVVLFPVALGASGALLALIWLAVFYVFRQVVNVSRPQARLPIDLAVGVICFAAGYEGGWYLLPSLVLFAVGDARIDTARPHTPGPLVFAVAAALAGWTAVAWILFGPMYSTASSSIGPTGLEATVHGSEGMLSAGLSPLATAMLGAVTVALSLAVLATWVHQREPSTIAAAVVLAAMLLVAVVSVLGALSIGPWLVPSLLLLALAAYRMHALRQVVEHLPWRRG